MSASQQRPLWLEDLKAEILNNQNENHRKTEVSIAGVTSNLALISDGLDIIKTKVSEVISRMNAVEARAEDTTKRVDEMDDKFREFKRELLNQFEFFTQQAKVQANQH